VPNGTVLSDTATVSSTTADDTSSNNSATVDTRTITRVDLNHSKTGPAAAVAETQATYTVTVTNHGPIDAQNVSLNDTIPTGATFAYFGSAMNWDICSTSQVGPISCSYTSSASAATHTLSLHDALPICVPNGTVLSDTATVSSTTADDTSGNNSATV